MLQSSLFKLAQRLVQQLQHWIIMQARIQTEVIKITNKNNLFNHDQLGNQEVRVFQISSNPKEV